MSLLYTNTVNLSHYHSFPHREKWKEYFRVYEEVQKSIFEPQSLGPLGK